MSDCLTDCLAGGFRWTDIDYEDDLFMHLHHDDCLDVLFLPVPDGHAPLFEQVDAFLHHTDAYVARGKRVVVHCQAGVGRTAVFLAAYLMHKHDLAPDAAISMLRHVRPQSMQLSDDYFDDPFVLRHGASFSRNLMQESFVECYYEYMTSSGVSSTAPTSPTPSASPDIPLSLAPRVNNTNNSSHKTTSLCGMDSCPHDISKMNMACISASSTMSAIAEEADASADSASESDLATCASGSTIDCRSSFTKHSSRSNSSVSISRGPAATHCGSQRGRDAAQRSLRRVFSSSSSVASSLSSIDTLHLSFDGLDDLDDLQESANSGEDEDASESVDTDNANHTDAAGHPLSAASAKDHSDSDKSHVDARLMPLSTQPSTPPASSRSLCFACRGVVSFGPYRITPMA
ncbi:hypothetical protein BC831DRAFT_476281 [Entophlyctis helioformis]|nr:hypothetical protein BC831DRAFT_476261 [Entophlyctis helioformis]KAI8921660.1 hypothetical protein BC831DRAFT_476281 [Entophlyctis helioformis]